MKVNIVGPGDELLLYAQMSPGTVLKIIETLEAVKGWSRWPGVLGYGHDKEPWVDSNDKLLIELHSPEAVERFQSFRTMLALSGVKL